MVFEQNGDNASFLPQKMAIEGGFSETLQDTRAPGQSFRASLK